MLLFSFFFPSCFVLGWSQGWGLEVNMIRMHYVKFPNNQKKYIKNKIKIKENKTNLKAEKQA